MPTAYTQLQKSLRRLRSFRRRVFEPGRFEYHAKTTWWLDQAWVEPYRDVLERDALDGYAHTRILDRRFQLVQLALAVKNLPGSTAECGVFRGVGSGLICRTLTGTYQAGECHLGFDSFDGVSEPEPADYMADGRTNWKRGKLRTPKEDTEQFLSRFDFCHLHQGWIPDCLPPAADHQFRLVHIDVDLRQPTWDSLAFFYPRMVPGGVIVLDDHGFVDCPGARTAAIEFFANKPEPIIECPTGQGFVFKR